MFRHISRCSTIISFLTTGSVFADDPGQKLHQVADNHDKYAESLDAERDTVLALADAPSMLTEIRAVLDSTRIAELVLMTELGTTDSPELTRRLGALKRASRMRILHIQLKYARDEGRARLERRILNSIEDLQRPTSPGGPRLTERVSPPPEATEAVRPAGGSRSR